MLMSNMSGVDVRGFGNKLFLHISGRVKSHCSHLFSICLKENHEGIF